MTERSANDVPRIPNDERHTNGARHLNKERSMSNRRPYRLAVVIAGAGLLASCTSGGEAEETSQTTVEETTESTAEDFVIAYESPTADDFNKLLVSRDDLVGLQQAEILNVENGADTPDGDSSSLVVSFEMESHYCFGVQTNVTESDNELIIEVLTGQLPDVDSSACEYGIYPYTTEVALQAPVGERTITPAEPREPTELAEPDESTSTGGISDSTTSSDPDASSGDTTSGGETGAGDTTTGDTTTGDTGTGDTTASTSPESTTEQPTDETTVTTVITPPNEQSGAAPVPGASNLIGMYVEDGVEWALDNGLEWRVLSFDGVPFAEASPNNPERISFVVEADIIVSLEWS